MSAAAIDRDNDRLALTTIDDKDDWLYYSIQKRDIVCHDKNEEGKDAS